MSAIYFSAPVPLENTIRLKPRTFLQYVLWLPMMVFVIICAFGLILSSKPVEWWESLYE